MGEQSVVSVTHEGKMVCKVVAGCRGNGAILIERAVRKTHLLNPYEIYKLAVSYAVGCDRCLVVQTGPHTFIPPDAGDEIGEDGRKRWAEHWEDPRFNPRWDNGTAAHIHVVDI